MINPKEIVIEKLGKQLYLASILTGDTLRIDSAMYLARAAIKTLGIEFIDDETEYVEGDIFADKDNDIGTFDYPMGASNPHLMSINEFRCFDVASHKMIYRNDRPVINVKDIKE